MSTLFVNIMALKEVSYHTNGIFFIVDYNNRLIIHSLMLINFSVDVMNEKTCRRLFVRFCFRTFPFLNLNNLVAESEFRLFQ